MHMMEHGERAEADAGYTGLPEHITMPVDARAPNGRSIPRRPSGLSSAGVFLSPTGGLALTTLMALMHLIYPDRRLIP